MENIYGEQAPDGLTSKRILSFTPYRYTGWWFGTMDFYDFPFSWEFHHPN